MTDYWKRYDSLLRCSFCQRRKDAVRKFISGPSVYICDGCVAIADEIISAGDEALGAADAADCSFCGKRGVRAWLVWGELEVANRRCWTTICGECVMFCREILEEDDERERAEASDHPQSVDQPGEVDPLTER